MPKKPREIIVRSKLKRFTKRKQFSLVKWSNKEENRRKLRWAQWFLRIHQQKLAMKE